MASGTRCEEDEKVVVLVECGARGAGGEVIEMAARGGDGNIARATELRNWFHRSRQTICYTSSPLLSFSLPFNDTS